MTFHQQLNDPTDTTQEVRSKVVHTLSKTPFAVSDLRRLSGGTANFIYHATLKQSTGDEYRDGVVIKHGEGYVATHPSFKISTSRCAIEYESLIRLAGLPPLQVQFYTISTPKTYYFNYDTNTQIQEYLPHATSLKEYVLKHFSHPTTSTHKPLCDRLGHALGAWLRMFHDWSQEPKQVALRETFVGNKDGQGLKNMINYQQLLQMVDRYPMILGDARDILQGVSDLAADELVDETALCPIHGDFWTGNVLIPDVSVTDNVNDHIPIRIVDWELSQLGVRPLDLGQFIAELWSLTLYRNVGAAEWLVRAFASGYGSLDDSFAYRTIIHAGVHLICFARYWSSAPDSGQDEQQKTMIGIGRGIIVKAWSRDREYFREHLLGCLFSSEAGRR